MVDVYRMGIFRYSGTWSSIRFSFVWEALTKKISDEMGLLRCKKVGFCHLDFVFKQSSPTPKAFQKKE